LAAIATLLIGILNNGLSTVLFLASIYLKKNLIKFKGWIEGFTIILGVIIIVFVTVGDEIL